MGWCCFFFTGGETGFLLMFEAIFGGNFSIRIFPGLAMLECSCLDVLFCNDFYFVFVFGGHH